MLRMALAALVFVLLGCPAAAEVVFVSPGESIRTAIGAAGPDGEVVLLPGVHSERLSLLRFSHPVIIRGQNGPDATILDAGFDGPAILIHDSQHLVSISGVTFTGGRGLADAAHPCSVGGAIALVRAQLRVEDCRFLANRACKGGALYVERSDAEAIGCEFDSNTALDGGAIWVNDGLSSLTVADSTFRQNAANNGAVGTGGAIAFAQLTAAGQPSAIDRSRFIANRTRSGGALYLPRFTSLTVRDSLFFGNSADEGGAVWCASWAARFENCTIAGNLARHRGGGMLLDANPTVVNSIIALNQAAGGQSAGDQIALADQCCTWRFTHCCLPHGFSLWHFSSETNIEADPQFVDIVGPDGIPFSGDEDLTLAPCSPAIDAGDSSLVTSATDLSGGPRIVDAFEYIDTGVPDGQGSTVDMGAHEAGASIAACTASTIGACCLSEGACADALAERTCMGLQGTFNGSYSHCDDIALVRAHSSPGLPLPLGVAAHDTITLPESLPVEDLVVYVLIDRASADFLRITVSHAGEEVLLMSSGCIGPGGVDLFFWDPSPEELFCDGRADSGDRARPLEPLAAFQGLDAAGTWTLTATSERSYDEGTLLNWAVEVRPSRPCPICIADHLQDGAVDVFDLLAFLDHWFADSADVNGDGVTDLLDLLAFVNAWFAGCP